MTDATQPRMARGRLLPAGILAAALFALLVLAPVASASSDPVASGTTKVNLNKNFARKLFKARVKIFKISPGSVNLKKRFVKLPVKGGSMDPTNGIGTLEHKGGFKLKKGKRTVAFKVLEINTKNKTVKGKVGKKKMTIAKLVGISSTREGFGVGVKANKLKLRASAAKYLNKALAASKKKKLRLFKANQVIGSSKSATQPATVAVLPTGDAQLTLSKEATIKLGTLGPEVAPGVFPFAVHLSLIEPAKVIGGTEIEPLISLPIGGGELAPTATAGTLQTTGGLKLVQDLEGGGLEPNGAGKTTLEMANIWLDLGAKTASVEVIITNPNTPAANLGNLGRASIAEIDLSGATITSDPNTRTISVQNGYATLQAVTAATLNQVFAEPIKAGEVFKAGDPLGHFSFTAQTQ